jgi:hypothetical protein
MREELTMSELDDQRVELLPARDTLHMFGSVVNIWASNSALAFNVNTIQSNAQAFAGQTIVVG